MDVCLDKKNLGPSKCAKLPSLFRSMITTPNGFKVTAEQAVDPEFWQAQLLAGKAERIYLWPDFVGFTDQSEAAVYENTPLAVLLVRDGRYNFKFDIKENLCLHKAMFTHRSISGRVFFQDVDNQLFGTTNADGDFMGFRILLLNTEKLMISNGTVSTKSPVVVVLADNLEIDQNGALLDAAFVNALERLTDVTLTVGAGPTDDEVVVTVKVTCDGTPVNGLEEADFILKKADGTVQVITGMTEDDGVYTLTGAGGWVTGTVRLKAPADLSLEAYEGNVATVTIV